MGKKMVLGALAGLWSAAAGAYGLTYGVRPFYLIDDMDEGRLKSTLQACAGQKPAKTAFSIGHRGAPQQFPEHTEESYLAAARSGAGMLECDVAFTRDKELVCRHSHADLHTTTNILATPLAAKCSRPFTPAKLDARGRVVKEADALCRTTDITLAEFKTLKGKMDGADKAAQTVAEYMRGTPAWRTDNYGQNGTLMSFRDSIRLFKKLGVKQTPELKKPDIAMPFDGFSQEQYAQKLIDELKAEGVRAEDVYPQSFEIGDVRYWIRNAPDYGRQAVLLDEESDAERRIAQMPGWREEGIRFLAPALPLLLAERNGKIGASDYAREANRHGFKLIAWTLERSGPLTSDGDWYYKSIDRLVGKDGDVYEVVDVLAREAKVAGIFSDWPATVTYYANCRGLK